MVGAWETNNNCPFCGKKLMKDKLYLFIIILKGCLSKELIGLLIISYYILGLSYSTNIPCIVK